jgi:hypothetical protein
MRRTPLATLVLAWAACAHPASTARVAHPDEALALGAVAAGPWNTDVKGWGPLCPPSAPCDTVFLDPNIAFAPSARNAVWFPHRHPTLFVLTGAGDAARAGQPVVRLGDWATCNTPRGARPSGGPERACAAVAFPDSAHASTDSVLVIMVAVTPAHGMSWSQLVMRKEPGGKWTGYVAKFSAE